MSYVHISRIAPSKYGDGDRWRLEIDGEWYDAYLTPDARDIQPGDHEVEFKTSPKTGKVYAVAIDGRYRTGGGQQRQAAPVARPAPGSAPRPAAPPAAPPAETKPGAKDMWIMATSIIQAVIAQAGCSSGNLVDLAREAANAARAAARVLEGAPVDTARAALAAAAPGPARSRAPNPPQPDGDPDDPRNFGSDPGEPGGGLPFDDDIPF